MNHPKTYIPRRVLLLLVLLLTMCLRCPAQTPPKNDEVSFARHDAEYFIRNSSSYSPELKLKLEEFTDRLFFFNDMQSHVFLLMARDSYAPLLSSPVLAFSIGVPHSKGFDNETFKHLFFYYDNLLKDMAEGRTPKETSTSHARLRIPPMLHTIRWRQFHMDGVFHGQTEPVLSGCGAVAVGQLMKFYAHPSRITGDFAYKDRQQNLRSLKMDGTVIEWDKISNIYRYDERRHSTLDPLMIPLATALMSDFGKDATVTYDHYFKRALVTQFGYSPAMFSAYRRRDNDSVIMRLVREELKAGRPCILAGGRHLFVCDGAYDDFLHLNMGWGGSYDGWYRFPAVGDRGSEKPFIESALLNIFPQKTAGITKSVTVTTPGSLPSLLPEEERPDISTLKVSGRLNGTDIRLLRRMAGAVEPEDLFSWKGTLTSLDLSDAVIVSDTVAYAVIDTRNRGFTVDHNGKKYDLSTITDAEWEEICKAGNNETPFYTVVRSDTSFLVRVKTMDGTIGYSMFSECENLRHITLPKNTRIISPCAFACCHCLKDITIPSGVYRPNQGSFQDCVSLDTVRVCSDSPILAVQERVNKGEYTYAFRNCSPNLRMVTDSTLETYASVNERQSPSRTAGQEARKKKEKKENKKDYTSYGMGQTVVSRYKMVNGKRVLVNRRTVK